MSIRRMMLRAYETSCHAKNVVKRMKNKSVKPENLKKKSKRHTKRC